MLWGIFICIKFPPDLSSNRPHQNTPPGLFILRGRKSFQIIGPSELMDPEIIKSWFYLVRYLKINCKLYLHSGFLAITMKKLFLKTIKSMQKWLTIAINVLISHCWSISHNTWFWLVCLCLKFPRLWETSPRNRRSSCQPLHFREPPLG